jgi:hypothetical protein
MLMLAFGLVEVFAPAPGYFPWVGFGFGLGFGRTAWGWFAAARCWLALRGRLPWRLMGFLADAHERRGVLRQAGASYQFRHAELQRHLAGRPNARHGDSRPQCRRLHRPVIARGLMVTGPLAVVVAAVAVMAFFRDVSTSDDDDRRPPPPAATITSIGDLADDRVTTVRGKSYGISDSPDHEIWVVIVPQDVGRFYPQGAAHPAADGTWAVSDVHVGLPTSRYPVLRFTVHAVVADESAAAVLHKYFPQNAFDSPGLAQLPAGATVTNSVLVAKK